jgi:hypothetical protein
MTRNQLRSREGYKTDAMSLDNRMRDVGRGVDLRNIKESASRMIGSNVL